MTVASGFSSATIAVPSKGLDTESAPNHVPSDKSPIVKNFLLGYQGRLPLRGTLRYSEPYTVGADPADPFDFYPPQGGHYGWWAFSSGGDALLYLPSHDAVEWPYVAPRPGDGQDDGTLGPMADLGPPVTDATRKIIGPMHTVVGSQSYGQVWDMSGASGANGPYIGTFNETNQDIEMRNVGGPSGVQAVCNHLDRLFVLGYSSSFNLNGLFWSDIGGPTSNTAAVWQDDATGLTNKIELPLDERAVGLARAGRNLLILRESSLYILSGLTPADFALRRVATIGCVAPQSIVEYNDGVFFQSTRGIEFFDGASVKTVSDDIRSAFQSQASRSGYLRCSAALVNGDHLMVVVGEGDPSVNPYQWFDYHIPTGGWVELSSNAFPFNFAPCWVGSDGKGTAVVLDGERIWNIDHVTRPNSGGILGLTAGFDYNHTLGQQTPIPAVYRTRSQKLGTPEQDAQLHRVMTDYRLSTNNGTGSWQVALWTPTDHIVPGGPLTLPADLQSDARLQRNVQDIFSESVDAIELELTLDFDNSLNIPRAELQDITLEFQTTRQRTP